MNKQEDRKTLKPIFVVGINRSGTKYLTNFFCNHSQVFGMQRDRKRSGGAMESNMLGGLRSIFRDLSRFDDYAGLVELWSSTDFFKLSGVDKELFYRVDPRPMDCMELFRTIMEELCRRNDAAYWVQKISPFTALGIVPAFRNAKFVVIKRSISDTIRSQIGAQARREGSRRQGLTKKVFLNILQLKQIKRLRKQGVVAASTAYENLRSDAGNEMQRICEALGIRYEPEMLRIQYRP
ncbi:MAG: hypothetical protein GF309_00150, partial [Candidatus Lokiarchaeota archaeon]|nr:hypothetical protein [Candidatus Lokiarchaeota archaeon]